MSTVLPRRIRLHSAHRLGPQPSLNESAAQVLGHARGLQKMAEKMAAYFGQPITDFRYAKFELIDGSQ